MIQFVICPSDLHWYNSGNKVLHINIAVPIQSVLPRPLCPKVRRSTCPLVLHGAGTYAFATFNLCGTLNHIICLGSRCELICARRQMDKYVRKKTRLDLAEPVVSGVACGSGTNKPERSDNSKPVQIYASKSALLRVSYALKPAHKHL